MQPSRHRPLLSLDANVLRTQSQRSLAISGSSRQVPDLQSSSRPQSVSDQQGGGDGPGKLGRLRSFVKVSGSVASHDSAEIQGRGRPSPSNSVAPGTGMLSGSSSNVWPAKTPSTRANDSGPLLTYTTVGGARVTLTLDRHIQYEADPTAASAWDFRNCKSAMLSNPFTPDTQHRDPFTDKEEFASVPRSLLCLSLVLEPFTSETSAWPKENFEFLSLQLDFTAKPGIEYSRHQRTISSPSLPSSRLPRSSNAAWETNSKIGAAIPCRPVVRGFAPMNLVHSNFLQEFGPTLYRSLQKQSDQSEEPVVLGSGPEGGRYRSFERHLAQVSKPIVNEGDKFTARGCQAMASACPTPASATFRQVSSPFTPTDVEAAEYGTSSIRIMVKRDAGSETSWISRKFPFLILLEHPAEAHSIDASIKLDLTTVRKSVHTVETPRTSLSSRYRPPSRSDSSTETLDPGYESSTSRYTSFSSFSNRRYGMHARSLSETSIRSSSGRHVEETEKLVQIFPRSDPISMISCGLGTVKDTLFQTGVVPKGSAKSTVSRSEIPGQSTVVRTPNVRSISSPKLNKPLPTPSKEESNSPPALPPRTTKRPSPQPLHKHSKSSASIPSMYERSGSFGSPPIVHHSASYDSSEGSSYSQDQDVLPKLQHFRQSHAQSVSVTTKAQRGSSRQASINSSWTSADQPALPPVPKAELSRLRLNSIPVTHQTESDGEVFDMVLTNWQASRMDREPIYALPVPGSPLISTPKDSKTFIQ